MSDINKVILIGRLTRDPELSHTSNGTAICKFSIAVSRTWSKDGQKQDEVSFINCDAWSKTGETIAEYVKKGHRIGIEGRLKSSTWDDKETGKKRSALNVIVDTFQFLQPKGDDQSGDTSPGGGVDRGSGEKPFDDSEIPF